MECGGVLCDKMLALQCVHTSLLPYTVIKCLIRYCVTTETTVILLCTQANYNDNHCM